jgi:hypothetical protein
MRPDLSPKARTLSSIVNFVEAGDDGLTELRHFTGCDQERRIATIATTSADYLSLTMNLAATPLSAAIAGAFSAWALPAFSKWLGGDADTSFNDVIGFLLLVALPAHAGVLGLRRQEGPQAQSVDKQLLIRAGAWLAAAAAVSGLLMLAR